ncbi:hypothetical protein E3P92_00275 [Wallemia ichthyophaga]|uniref:Rho GDP-dissociation inhibitor n=1 Tax=Wallemia ichthyophaga TaxID=245174 RepID=A0A4T0HUM9_WALIC|nr:hypothetical protein E3P98_00417 [Wallemia ichthyophaga]TIA97072.1 hypothetical protein E3P95_03007 [Wallemia ichthyophaga]TIA97715.1 hypothetical protein E3P94_03219 [Wallemia ichthyophaga]TIB16289.1 hypothetical protein E3P90_00563 [Wallemia ichthyophaga]TIB18031.1 hypothetical protein E3P93_00420 [Wallemia ichthyophaga]
MTEKIDDQELQTSTTPGYNPGEKKTLDEYAQLDSNDESLNKWKASLGIGTGAANENGPKIEFISLSLESATRPEPIVFNFAELEGKKEHIKKNPVSIKEGTEYNVKLDFKVNHDVISGLRYVQVVKRTGMTVDKMEEMVGSYGPSQNPYEKRFATEESPSGMLARGTYSVRSRIVDDDGHIYVDFDWAFKISKEW